MRRLEQESIANTVFEEDLQGNLFSGAAERYGARRDTQSDRVGESGFMPSGDLWWRAKLDLGSGEPFDDLHGSATVGTAIKICRVFRRGGVFLGRWF